MVIHAVYFTNNIIRLNTTKENKYITKCNCKLLIGAVVGSIHNES